MSVKKRFGLVVFGASGFTGRFVVREVARAADEERGEFAWAVAGRNRDKLQSMLQEAAQSLGKINLGDVGVIVCNINDDESLASMCREANVVLNCVGPYRFYGEPVVKACVENGANYVDICGEPKFLESMQLKYDKLAAEKGVYIVGSCGFDSIPADMGVLYTRDQFPGTLTAVESYLAIQTGAEGAGVHFGTWQSAIHGFSDQASLRTLRKKFGYKPLPVVGRKLTKRGMVFYSKDVERWAFPFPGSDASVVRRTQRFMHENLERVPLQYTAYATIGSVGYLLLAILMGIIFGLMARFSFGRKLLEKYPKLFSFGIFSHEGPTEKQMQGTSFSMTFFGEGFSQTQDMKQDKPEQKITTQVRGPDPGYVATSILMVQSGLTLLQERSALPPKGGVYTPGIAFGGTSLIKRLIKHGMHFSVLAGPK
uniref:Saccharopine dehydrogenase-like oxidoreductase n=1 Tax=Eptatretus burgeri TaxID=7764 RepID=A0A8C4N787_EPTBU